jgi:hypothetical protein
VQRDVAAYLRSGVTYVAAAGVSACRLCGAANGSTELTDGTHFVWPSGLAHYVEAHSVRLPKDVVAVATNGGNRVVDLAEFEREFFETGGITIDSDWWRHLTRD